MGVHHDVMNALIDKLTNLRTCVCLVAAPTKA